MRDQDKRAGELEFTPRDAGQALGELARELGAQVLDDFRRPEFRAGFGAAMITTAMLARTRLPGIAVILMSCMIGAGVEQLYGMALDIHESLTREPIELFFHGLGCPGHTTALPAESCFDAPGKI